SIHEILALSLPHKAILGKLHIFPTRRSSDLEPTTVWSRSARSETVTRYSTRRCYSCESSSSDYVARTGSRCTRRSVSRSGSQGRESEEHTSELQSREKLVCRLLLEKKKRSRI